MRISLTHNKRRLEEGTSVLTGAITLATYPWRRLVLAFVVVLGLAVLAASLGAVQIPPFTVLKIVLSRLPFIDAAHTWSLSWDTIIWDIRLPRVVLAGVVGASLGTSGATYQGLFRNPLADPYLIGAAGGAGLGAVLIMVSGVSTQLVPIAAFAGSLLAVSTAYLVARRSGGVPLTTLVLAGIAISSLTAAVTSLLLIRSSPDVKPLLGWLLGGFSGAQWHQVLLVLPYIIPGAALIIAYSRILNLFQVTEEEAGYLGVNVGRAKFVLIIAASLVTAAVVSISGPIGFVGLIAPHVVRLLWGPDHRFLLPMTFMVGAGFLILADLAARLLVSPGELPVGVITAFCGAPFFLYLLRYNRRASV